MLPSVYENTYVSAIIIMLVSAGNYNKRVMRTIQPYNVHVVFAMKFDAGHVAIRFHAIGRFQFERKQELGHGQVHDPDAHHGIGRLDPGIAEALDLRIDGVGIFAVVPRVRVLAHVGIVETDV